MFFQSEPIAYQVMVVNTGDVESALLLGSTDLQRLFSVDAFKAPLVPPDKFNIERPFSNGRDLDELDIDMPVVVSSPVKTWAGGAYPISMETETRLEPRDGIEWRVSLPTDLEPGLYRVLVRVNGTERGERPLRSFAMFRFEVRPLTTEALFEVLRRQAFRAWSEKDFITARRIAHELLAVHRNSAEAYRILALVSDAEGKRDEAALHRGILNEILRNGRDELLLKYRKERTIPQVGTVPLASAPAF